METTSVNPFHQDPPCLKPDQGHRKITACRAGRPPLVIDPQRALAVPIQRQLRLVAHAVQ